MVDSKLSEHGVVDAEMNLLRCDELPPFVERKKAPTDVQNESRTGNVIGRSPLSKKTGLKMDELKVSGIKRSSPEDPASPPNNNANTQLVYVRRKSETEMGKTSACDGRTCNRPLSRQLGQEETIQPDQVVNEPKFPHSSASSPVPVSSLTNAYGKTLALMPNGQPKTTFASVVSSYQHPTSAASSLYNKVEERNLHWEERYRELQILLKKLDEADKDEYVRMLWPLSSTELSRHAVELEKRSIQLSLEEVKEVHRVGTLNVLGKPTTNYKTQLQG